MHQDLFYFLSGGCLYPVLEIFYRGHSHLSMGIAGGISLCGIEHICCEHMKNRPLLLRCLVGGGIITGIELVTGLIVNRQLGLQVWDYSDKRTSLGGQICLPASLLWTILSLPAMGYCRACSHLRWIKD